MDETGCRKLAVPDGADVVEALERGAGNAAGWVMATGVLEDAELRVAGGATDPVRVAHGRHTLLSLAGPVGGPYQVVLARAGDSSLTVVGGTLRRGRAESVSAVLWPAASEVAAEAPSEPVRPSWAARAAAAAEAAGLPGETPQYRPAPGELVQHFAFGLCDVLKSSGDVLTIRDVKGPARIREIRIDLLNVQPPTQQDGKRVYRLTRKPRG